MKIVFGTGHRPGTGELTYRGMRELAEFAIETHPNHIRALICGMAPGWDLALADVAVAYNIPIWAVKPWAGYFPKGREVRLYNHIMDRAALHVTVDESEVYPGPEIYQIRNRWMVNNADEGIALWDGRFNCETFETIRYAAQVGKPVRNILDVEAYAYLKGA